MDWLFYIFYFFDGGELAKVNDLKGIGEVIIWIHNFQIPSVFIMYLWLLDFAVFC